ncbi:MAG: hypothetical protein IM319_10835 [Microcystis sp. M113S1]|uniref:hypothetical protein n=1 Tax=Microcystis sp. M113S1 TaxID=2771104 RepID=UPI00258A719C|nr:hypothetical protein [Microcystis sp. M113S1]MCA2939622.1 hypothetical protein [Microcystis sp. M113S1]
MARDKLITIRIEGEKREAFNQLAKAQNTDTASLLYDFINQCLDGRIDISLVTGKGQRIDNRLDTNRLDKLEIATQRLDNRIDGIETTTQRLAKRLDDWIEAIDDRLTDCDQGLSEKIITLEHRINALSFQLDRQDRQEIDTMEMTTQEIDNPPPSPPAIETAIEDTLGTGSETEIVSLSPSAKRKGLTDSELARHLGIDKSNITRWKQKGEPTQKYRETWELRGRFWHEKD